MSSISREKNRTALYETQRELYLSSRCNEEGGKRVDDRAMLEVAGRITRGARSCLDLGN